MSNMTSEINSPTIDEASNERNMVKRGPWTAAEDAVLVDYVTKHGEGNWNTVERNSGLCRPGKSCRLRWANHLRPDLKKGPITPEEENRIIELHRKLGNKWANIVAKLPGRTDNEIKNYWNTRIKRRQRAGLRLYPDEYYNKKPNENSQTENTPTETLPDNISQFPAVQFKNYKYNPKFFEPNILDLPGGSYGSYNYLPHEPGPSCNNDFLSNPPPPKRIKRSDSYPDFDVLYRKNDRLIDMSSLLCSFSGSHAYFNGESSSCEPISRAHKTELPSLQYSSPSLPFLQSFDTLFQSNLIGQTKSTLIGQTVSDSRGSGLLEAVPLQSQNLRMSEGNNNDYNDNNYLNALFVPCDITDGWPQNNQGDELEPYSDLLSPLGQSAVSVYSEYIPYINGSPIDEHQSVPTVSVKNEAGVSGTKHEDDKPNQINNSQPEFPLPNWSGSPSNDLIRSTVDDFSNEFKHIYDPPIQGQYDPDRWDEILDFCNGSGTR